MSLALNQINPVRLLPGPVLMALILIALAAIFLSLSLGAVALPITTIPRLIFFPESQDASLAAVLTSIRLPRIVLGVTVGIALSLAGCLMQTLFRNPLAEPGLLGVSTGAALAAIIVIIFGNALAKSMIGGLGPYLLPCAAFFGALLAMAATLWLGKQRKSGGIARLLLAGIAVNALCSALMGLFIYIADDQQVRQLTFWTLGSLGGATWATVLPVLTITLLSAVVALHHPTALNLLLLGDAEARQLGIDVVKLKTIMVITSALLVGASVAITGIIGFVGLVVPHLTRLLVGPDHRILLPSACILGISLVVGADLSARLVIIPSELPIGLITGALGGPFLLWLMHRQGIAR